MICDELCVRGKSFFFINVNIPEGTMLCLGFSIGVMGSFKVYRKLEKTGRHEGRKG